ncbi:MAG: Trk family potassium uptake protein [Clostridia bacterium]|nr:Trk family potassium uptake protein [Clostridia bacterium]
MVKTKRKFSLSSFQLIIIGFIILILIGAAALTLPVCSASGESTPFIEALFTATSAGCVTGLIVRDTAVHWSVFGQVIILILIQIGGLGVITVAASVSMIAGKKISLKHKSTMQESLSAPKLGGITNFTGFIVKATFITEFAGTLLLLPYFLPRYGASGIWKSLFHSISAFCNAGFDLMRSEGAEFQSLTSCSDSVYANIVIMLLIIVGGIGFLTWEDVIKHKFRIRRYRMQSKVVLVTSAVLIVIPAALFFFGEYANLPAAERISASFFQSVTTRTAGFNTADLSALSGAGRIVMIVLMLIGGSPGSTAGGMKTTTAAVLFSNAVSVIRRRDDTQFFGRRIAPGVVKTASAILFIYASLFLCGGAAISLIEKLPIGTCLFETASAVGTVGITLGITPTLGLASRFIIIILMFFGRVGALTIVYAAVAGKNNKFSKYPLDDITVG